MKKLLSLSLLALLFYHMLATVWVAVGKTKKGLVEYLPDADWDYYL